MMGMQVTVVGGGMIVHDQILPSLYHLQRRDVIGQISIAATSTARLRDLVNPTFEQAFPGQTFVAHPELSTPPEKRDRGLYRQVVADMPPRQLVVIATPETLHFDMVSFCLEHDQHVMCVKPLALQYEHAVQLDQLAKQKGLLLGVEYHKRFDRRALEARRQYQQGMFGQFKCGYACLIEPWLYRNSNFQNWFTKDQTDPFTYIGCHYVDQVYYITGLRPVQVSLVGVDGVFPNGNEAYMWANGRVTFENGSLLSVNTGLGYPDQGAGPNDQGITMYCEGADAGAIIKHDDQFRGVRHGYLQGYRFINPDYFRLVPWDGPGLRPVGYGYDSIEGIVTAAIRVESSSANLSGNQAVEARREELTAIDQRGIIATAANSGINELVVEAARKSIVQGGKPFGIEYDPTARVVDVNI